MDGTSVSPAFLGTKIVSIYRGNAAKGLPSVLGTYLLHDGATGAPLAAMDGTRLTCGGPRRPPRLLRAISPAAMRRAW